MRKKNFNTEYVFAENLNTVISTHLGRTDVIVVEGGIRVAYTLDEALIEFGTAIDDGDLPRAVASFGADDENNFKKLFFIFSLSLTISLCPKSTVAYLEAQEGRVASSLWSQLAEAALEQQQLHVAKRAYAALGDIARVPKI